MTGVGKQQAILCFLIGVYCAACGLACAIFVQGQGKNGFDSFPLFYYEVLTFCPLMSFAALVRLWRLRRGTVWLLALGLLLTVPQVLVFGLFLEGLSHYA